MKYRHDAKDLPSRVCQVVASSWTRYPRGGEGIVFAGSAAWWLCLSGTSALLCTRIPAHWIEAVAVLSSFGVGLMGLVQMISGGRRLLA
jgi:hypothetical protein